MHNCEFFDYPSGGYGSAVNECWEKDDELWVGNGEYASRVNYCPRCGYMAKKVIEEDKKDEKTD